MTAGKENRGIADYVGNEFPETWNKPVTVDMFGNSFFHDYTCFGDDNVYAYLSDTISNFSKMFIASVISAQNDNSFSYSRQFRQGDADNLTVKLPARKNSQGEFEPDWKYMEDYMKNIETKAKSRVNFLQMQTQSHKIT